MCEKATMSMPDSEDIVKKGLKGPPRVWVHVRIPESSDWTQGEQNYFLQFHSILGKTRNPDKTIQPVFT